MSPTSLANSSVASVKKAANGMMAIAFVTKIMMGFEFNRCAPNPIGTKMRKMSLQPSALICRNQLDSSSPL